MRKSHFFNLQISGKVYLKMVIISFFNLYKIHIFPKFGGCGSKIEPSTLLWILNFKWAWQAQFLSHNLLILQNCIFFEDKQMILLPFAKILKGIKVTNFGHSCHIHSLSHPWLASCYNCTPLHCVVQEILKYCVYEGGWVYFHSRVSSKTKDAYFFCA